MSQYGHMSFNPEIASSIHGIDIFHTRKFTQLNYRLFVYEFKNQYIFENMVLYGIQKLTKCIPIHNGIGDSPIRYKNNFTVSIAWRISI